MTQKQKRFIAVLLAVSAGCYLLIAFVKLNINAAEWDLGARLIFALVFVPAAAIFALLSSSEL